MRDLEGVKARVISQSPVKVEVFDGDVMLGVWEQGYVDVWAFALGDKDVVRDATDAELCRQRLPRRA